MRKEKCGWSGDDAELDSLKEKRSDKSLSHTHTHTHTQVFLV